jgi:hypothetical protein
VERRNDERDRLRQACADELRELREADADETSEVVADVAARTAARTARQLSVHDTDPPEPKKPKPVALAAAIISLMGVLAAVAEAFRQAFAK